VFTFVLANPLYSGSKTVRLGPACRQAGFTKDGSLKGLIKQKLRNSFLACQKRQTVLASGCSKSFIHVLLFDSRGSRKKKRILEYQMNEELQIGLEF
jgi:hypothetical protein